MTRPTRYAHAETLAAHIPAQRPPSERSVARDAWSRAMAAGMGAYRAAHGDDLAARAEAGIAAALVIYTDHLRGVIPPVGSVPPPTGQPLAAAAEYEDDRKHRWLVVLDTCRDRGLWTADVAARTGRAAGGTLRDDLRDLRAAGLLRFQQGGLDPGYRTTAAGCGHLDQHARRTLTGED